MQFIALILRGGWRFAISLLALLALPFAALAQAGPAGEPRLALVIGNAAYRVSPLANPVNDARLMETALKNAGFQVIKAENASRRDMQRLIRDFGEKLKQSGGVGLFYFAGHGMQVRGNNYLIPLDADIRSEDEVAFDSIDAQSVLEKMETARNRVNLLILDACRDNPFIRGSRSATLGLATMNAPSGSLIAYSTAPGSVASDGKGQNSLYTEQLARMMQEPGLPVEDVFKQVRVAVRRASNNQQTPWENTALEGNFYFKSGPPQAVAPETPVAAPRPSGNSQPPAPVAVAQSSAPQAARAVAAPGNLGVLVLRDKLTRKEQRIDVSESPAEGGGMRYSTGDVVASDGQARAVRMGVLVATLQEGALWKFPLQAGSAGAATIKIDGVSLPGKVEWTVTDKSGSRATVEARLDYVIDGATSTSFRRKGTWRGQYEDGIPVAVSHDFEIRSTATGSAPDLFTGELKLAAPSALPAAVAAAPAPKATAEAAPVPAAPQPAPASPPAAAAKSAEPPPEEIKLDAADANQEAVEAKSDSGSPLTYRMIVVLPPFFHGYTTDTLSGITAAAPGRIANYVKQEKIDIGAILRTEFDRQLRATTEYANWAKRGTPLRINLKYRYGISTFMLSAYKPLIAVAVAVYDPSGKVFWQGTDRVGALSGSGSTASMPYDAYFSSPERFKSAFEGAARVVVQSMMKQVKLPAN